MDPAYSDVRSRIAEEPSFVDQHGVPRYGPFRPGMLGVYDNFAVLYEVQCQSCGQRLRVCEGRPRFSAAEAAAGRTEPWSLEEVVASLDHGDAPLHDFDGTGRCAGTTMGSWAVAVVEAWERGVGPWTRRGDLEGAVAP